MYQLNDTIAAISSPTSDKRVIVRITGPNTVGVLQQIFSPPRPSDGLGPPIPREKGGLIAGSVAIDSGLVVDANLYLFLAPHSYTGETLAEIHIYTSKSVTETLMGNLLGNTGVPVRMAGPGEFTARSFLNGKIDLAQAEAVNEVIVSSNKFQLAAAEKLLSGRLAQTTEEIRSSIMDCISRIEASLDFSAEDVEFITRPQAIELAGRIKQKLQQLLADSIRCESVIDLPAVGIAGAPNAGKSWLLNKMLGKARSIVSSRRKTTRDVLTAVCTLDHCRCVLFDCAGLIPAPGNILDELAQTAAVESLGSASVVVFCVDISKEDWSEDLSILDLINGNWLNPHPVRRGLRLPPDQSPITNPQLPTVIPVATKSDLLLEDTLAEHLAALNQLFGADFLVTSARTGTGVERLRNIIDKRIIELATDVSRTRDESSIIHHPSSIILTARHKQAVTEAIENIGESVAELKADNDEVAAMMLRAAYQAISSIEGENIDEQVLEWIFKHFCIGK